MATSGLLPQLAGSPAPTFGLERCSVFQNSINAASDGTRHRGLGHMGVLAASPQVPVAFSRRALAAREGVGGGDQSPAQPPRALAGDGAVDRDLATVPGTRYQTRMVQEGAGGVETGQVSDLAPDHRRQHMPEAGDGLQQRHLGKSRSGCQQFRLAAFALGAEKIVEANTRSKHNCAPGESACCRIQARPLVVKTHRCGRSPCISSGLFTRFFVCARSRCGFSPGGAAAHDPGYRPHPVGRHLE